ncbi:hypothetical protein N9747_06550, partial [Planktomarina sp.]|nr:hypothetical protein [Planktomarina sp.]
AYRVIGAVSLAALVDVFIGQATGQIQHSLAGFCGVRSRLHSTRQSLGCFTGPIFAAHVRTHCDAVGKIKCSVVTRI